LERIDLGNFHRWILLSSELTPLDENPHEVWHGLFQPLSRSNSSLSSAVISDVDEADSTFTFGSK
jgi:hypothetical protein